MSMTLTLIAAMTPNRVIGKDNQLPWRLSNDLKHFKHHTEGKVVIMGRKTFDSIGKPLPNRTNIVITRSGTYQPEGVVVAPDPGLALDIARSLTPHKEVMVIGGEQIYRLFLPLAHRLILTQVHATVEGDSFFPEFSSDDWVEVHREDHPADEKNEYDYSFIHYQRNSGN